MGVLNVIGIAIAVASVLIVLTSIVATFIEIWRSPRLDPVSRALWLVGILVAPIVGSLLWLSLSSREPVTVDEVTRSR